MRIFSVDDWAPPDGRMGPYYDDCCFLGLEFDAGHWSALFEETLGLKPAENYREGEDVRRYYLRQELAFRKGLSGYPMLSRLWDVYTAIWFDSGEVDQLLAECQDIERLCSQEPGAALLKLLIKACEQCQAVNQGLVLGG